MGVETTAASCRKRNGRVWLGGLAERFQLEERPNVGGRCLTSGPGRAQCPGVGQAGEVIIGRAGPAGGHPSWEWVRRDARGR